MVQDPPGHRQKREAEAKSGLQPTSSRAAACAARGPTPRSRPRSSNAPTRSRRPEAGEDRWHSQPSPWAPVVYGKAGQKGVPKDGDAGAKSRKAAKR